MGTAAGSNVAAGSVAAVTSVGSDSTVLNQGEVAPQQLPPPVFTKCIATPISCVPLRCSGMVSPTFPPDEISRSYRGGLAPQVAILQTKAVCAATSPVICMHSGNFVPATAHVDLAKISPQATKIIPGFSSPEKPVRTIAKALSLPVGRSSQHQQSRESSPLVRCMISQPTSSFIGPGSNDTKPSTTSSLSPSELSVVVPDTVDLTRSQRPMLYAQRIAPSTIDRRGTFSPPTMPPVQAGFQALLGNQTQDLWWLSEGERCCPRKQSLETNARTTTKQQHEVEGSCASVVFLDIDGVLHPWQSDRVFCTECCWLYERIIRRTCAVTVLSSTWRKYPHQIEMVENILKLLKLDPIYDCTIDLGRGADSRAEEILEWLGRHPEVKNWIAIDDVDLTETSSQTPCGHLLRGHFVHTNADEGILPEDVDLAVQLLGGDVHVVVKV